MISYFCGVYPDELLYSIIGRYSSYACTDGRDALYDAFLNYNSIPTIEFPSYLKNLSETLVIPSMDSNTMIQNHTLFPYYEPFLPVNRQIDIKNKMIYGDGKGIKMEIGFVAGSLCKKNTLFYCPECARFEFSVHGEAYFHRVHQAQGVFCCPKHNCLLLEYPIKIYDYKRLSFITINSEEISMSKNPIGTDYASLIIADVASSAEKILSNCLKHQNKESIFSVYKDMLWEKGYVTINGSIRQQDLCKAIGDYYGDKILGKFESPIDTDNEYNWVKIISRDLERVVHPIRHILFINFLFGNIENLIHNFSNLNHKGNKTFYPCLNPASDHYRQFVVDDVKISSDCITKEEIGTFKCDCGFIYTRKMKADIYRISRIKQFGEIWEEKLRRLIESQLITTTRISLELRCDYKTVVKYASKLGIKNLLKTNMKIEFVAKVENEENLELLCEYKRLLMDYILGHPEDGYTKVHAILLKEFSYVYKHDKKWIECNVPVSNNSNKNRDKRQNWDSRDTNICENLKQIYDEMLSSNTKHITKTKILRKTGKQATIEKNLDKLPMCRDFLNQICSKECAILEDKQ